MADPRMTRHIDRLWPEPQGLFEAGEIVQEFTSHPGWAVIARVIKEERDEIRSRLDHAVKPPEQAEYALAHGRLDGLVAMEEAALAVLTRFEQRLQQQRDLYEHAGESA
jgi:hypothetical protein